MRKKGFFLGISLFFMIGLAGCGCGTKKIELELSENPTTIEIVTAIDTALDTLTETYLNESGMIERDNKNLEKAVETVYDFSKQLIENDVIENSGYCKEGNTVSFFLKDGGTYIYAPVVQDCYTSADEYTVMSVDTLSMVSDAVISTLSGSGSEDAAQAINSQVPEYSTWTAYDNSMCTVLQVMELLGSLNENNVRAVFWRGHGNVYVDRDGKYHIAFGIGEKVTDAKKEEYAWGLSEVSSNEALKKIADNCPSDARITSQSLPLNEFNTANYILMNDIVCPDQYDSAGLYSGVIDGNGYTISNISKPLFVRITSSTIKNLGIKMNYSKDLEDEVFHYGGIAGSDLGSNTIENCFAKGNVQYSCRSGCAGAFVGSSDTTNFINCYNEADIAVNTRQGSYAGGIGGEGGYATNCFNTGNISAYASGEGTWNEYSIEVYTGGIIGYDGFVDTCYNTGAVTSGSAVGCSVCAGGILGATYDSYSERKIFECFNTGYVKVYSNYSEERKEDYEKSETEFQSAFGAKFFAGGIVGYARDNTVMEKCWNGGHIQGKTVTGGIVGYTPNNDEICNCYNLGPVTGNVYAGGIIGYASGTCLINSCYNMGEIKQAANQGAIAGGNINGGEQFKYCYYKENGISATATGASYSGAKALSEGNMSNITLFEGFDFASVWKLAESDAYPRLRY